MGNSSKDKGKRVERDVCALFNKVFNLSFCRVPNSGAFIGGTNVIRMANMSSTQILLSKGDIIPPTELDELLIECKGRKEIPFHLFMRDEGHKELNSWIEQVEVDWKAAQEKGFYCIVMLPNRKGFFICYNKKYVAEGIIPIKNHLIYVHNNTEYVLHELSIDWLTKQKEWLLINAKSHQPN